MLYSAEALLKQVEPLAAATQISVVRFCNEDYPSSMDREQPPGAVSLSLEDPLHLEVEAPHQVLRLF